MIDTMIATLLFFDKKIFILKYTSHEKNTFAKKQKNSMQPIAK